MNHPLARTWTEHVTAPICGILSAWYCLLCLRTVRLSREKRGAAVPCIPHAGSPRGSTGPRGAQGKLQQQLGPIPPQKAPASLCTGGSKKIRQESGPLAAGSGKTQPRKSQLGLCPTTKGANRKSSSLLREYSVLSAPRKQASTPQEKAYFCWVNLQIARRFFIFSSSLLRTSSRRRFPYQPAACSGWHTEGQTPFSSANCPPQLCSHLLFIACFLPR